MASPLPARPEPATFDRTVTQAAPPSVVLVGGGGVPELRAAVARRGLHPVLFHFDLGQPLPPSDEGLSVVTAPALTRPLDVVRALVKLPESHGAVAIAPVTEYGLLPAAMAASQLGLPGPGTLAVYNTRDKRRMRLALERAGLPQLRWAACGNLAEAREFMRSVGGAIILKPVSGSGSEGVSRVGHEDLLESAWQLASSAEGFAGVLCEEYVEGPEVSLEGYSVSGHFVPVALTDKVLDARFIEVGHQQPSAHPPEVFQAVADLAARSLKALGVRDAVSHSEFRLGPRGPVLIETHTRFGGGCIHVLTRLSTGVDLADVLVGLALGEQPDVRPQDMGQGAAVRLPVGQHAGVLEGLEFPARQPGDGLHDVRSYYPAGHALTGRGSSRARLGHVIATGPTVAAAAERAEAYVAGCRVVYRGGDTQE